MFKITLVKPICSFVFYFWLLHFAPFWLLAIAPHRHLVEPFSSLLSTRRGLVLASPGNSNDNDQNGSTSILINEIPRLPPVWNGAPVDNDQQRPIDFTQLFELMGEPRGSRGRELSELITRPKPKCNRRIRILNGVTRIRERGSLARFICSHGFTLIGPTTIVCLRDRWSEPPPICVKSGCRPIRRPQNAEMRQSIGGAVVAFYCLGETKLTGDPILFCDGIRWNGTEPSCDADAITAATTPWPESGATTPFWNFSVENGEQDNNSWDSNLQISFSTTTEEEHSTAETDFSTNDETTTPSFHMSTTEPHSLIIAGEHRTFEPVTEIISYTEFPEHDTIRTENKQFLVPTENPIVFPHEMGHNETVPAFTVNTTTTITNTNTVTPVATPPEQATVHASTTLTAIQLSKNSVSFGIPDLAIKNTNAAIVIPPTSASPPRRRPTKRPRRPALTRRPARRPFRRTTTTTTVKPLKPKLPIFNFSSSFPPPPPVPPFTTLSASKDLFPNQDSPSPSSMDYPVAIDKEFLPREQVEPVRPIIYPDMLNNNAYYPGGLNTGDLGHASMIIGITLVAVGLATFSAGVVLYCWRKNKGIARARPYDMDGRTLSAHDANDDFMWMMDQRDSGL